MKLTPRLEMIASLIPNCDCIGDVGTDHAYIPVALTERKIVNKAIASDIVDGPIDNAKKTVVRYDMSDNVEVRKGAGLEPYKIGEIQGVIIAGMGGMLISDIIDDRFELAHSLDFMILQPMIGQEVLRSYLEKHNFKIVEEYIETEGEKFYVVMKVITGKMIIEDPLLYEIGPLIVNQNNEKTKSFLTFKLKKYNKIRESLLKSNSVDNKVLLKEIDEKINKLEEWI